MFFPFLHFKPNPPTNYFRVNEEAIPDALDQIVEIPKADEVDDAKKIQELLNKTKVFTRDEFSKLLFKCHNIIRNNDKLSPEAAFDETSKILFMKIRYEREQARNKQVFSKEKFEELRDSYLETTGGKGKPFYQHFFDLTKDVFKDDEIFDVNDTIKIRETSFLQIVKELEKYNLSDTSDDVKGIAFEEFLGKTFRGELGQFFTPRTVVDYMVEILDPQEGEIICDPCCGSGGFLIKAFEYVREKIEQEIHLAKEDIKKRYYNDAFEKLSENEQQEITQLVNDLLNKLSFELELHNPSSRLRKLSYDCVFGTDANPRMARTAKMNMIMHGDGHGGVHHHDGLLNINGIYDGRFDVILTNPPFGARVEKNQIVELSDVPAESKLKLYRERYPDYEEMVVKPLRKHATDKTPLLDLFDVGEMSGLTEILFMERCLRLLKPGGRMGIVLPDGVLNTTGLQKVREYVEGKAKLVNITSIPKDVFLASGATVKPSLVFLKKFTDGETKQWNKIKEKAIQETDTKYKPEVDEAQKTLNAIEAKYDKASKELKDLNVIKGRKKSNVKINKDGYASLVENEAKLKFEAKAAKVTFDATLKRIKKQKEEEVKALIKEWFDYPVPVVEVEKAGISSTGAPIENELKLVAPEFTVYRKKEKLWKGTIDSVTYPVDEEGNITRIIGASEPEVFYGK